MKEHTAMPLKSATQEENFELTLFDQGPPRGYQDQ